MGAFAETEEVLAATELFGVPTFVLEDAPWLVCGCADEDENDPADAAGAEIESPV